MAGAELGIGLIETDKEKKSVKVDFQQSDYDTLEEYQRAYKSVYGKEIDLPTLVNALATKALHNDRHFKAWRKSQKNTNTPT